MDAAKYLVTVEPGAFIPGFGLVRAGGVFTAPAGFVPNATFRAMNLEAVLELDKVLAEAVELAKKRLEVVSGIADRARVQGQLQELEERRPRARVVVSDEDLGKFRAQRGYSSRGPDGK